MNKIWIFLVLLIPLISAVSIDNPNLPNIKSDKQISGTITNNYYNNTNISYITSGSGGGYAGVNPWLYNSSTQMTYNETHFNNTLNDFLTIRYYNATQSSAIAGTIAGTLADTQHQDAEYDGVTLNITEASGSPALDLRMNFTGITTFTRGVMRYKTTALTGNYPIIQLWNYETNLWEDYPNVPTSLSFATIEQGVFDPAEHISNGIVQMRLYKSTNGNTNNKYYVDWIAISRGFGTPSGDEVDPLSWHRNDGGESSNYNTTGNLSLNNILATGNGTFGGLLLGNGAYIYDGFNKSIDAYNRRLIAEGEDALDWGTLGTITLTNDATAGTENKLEFQNNNDKGTLRFFNGLGNDGYFTTDRVIAPNTNGNIDLGIEAGGRWDDFYCYTIDASTSVTTDTVITNYIYGKTSNTPLIVGSAGTASYVTNTNDLYVTGEIETGGDVNIPSSNVISDGTQIVMSMTRTLHDISGNANVDFSGSSYPLAVTGNLDITGVYSISGGAGATGNFDPSSQTSIDITGGIVTSINTAYDDSLITDIVYQGTDYLNTLTPITARFTAEGLRQYRNSSDKNITLIIYKVSDVQRFYPYCIVAENLSQWNKNITSGLMYQTKGRAVKTYNKNCVNNLLINDKDKTIQSLKSQLATATTKLNSMESKVNQICASATMSGVCK